MFAATCVALLLVTLGLWAVTLPVTAGQALVMLAASTLVAGWRIGLRAALLTLVAGMPVVASLSASANLLADRWPDTSNDVVPVEGVLCEFARTAPGSWRFVLTTDGESRARGAPGRVLVNWYDSDARPATAPEPGERWRLELRLRSPRGLSNPGGFDYERWLFSQHIGATAWVHDSAANVRRSGESATCPFASWRAATARRISAALDGREASPYVLGLAIGAYQALPEQEWEKLRRTGTIHLISISGFHIALVAAPAALLGLAIARVWLMAGRR
ncbi:MAG: ComEC/Rec2 family competence protein, partial [Gammaproteobacteria bacterium]